MGLGKLLLSALGVLYYTICLCFTLLASYLRLPLFSPLSLQLFYSPILLFSYILLYLSIVPLSYISIFLLICLSLLSSNHYLILLPHCHHLYFPLYFKCLTLLSFYSSIFLLSQLFSLTFRGYL
jgi:hypothetical protein